MREGYQHPTKLRRRHEVLLMQFQTSMPDTLNSLKCALASEVLLSSGKLRLRVTGWSMLPTIWPGDTLEIERIDRGSVSLGHVVLFGREGRVFAHRVVAIERVSDTQRFITQGDGMASPDPIVAASELLGQVRLIVRAGERIEPRTSLSVIERVAAFFIKRSTLAARIFVHFHNARQIPQEQVAVCQG